jgi:hypothetical protein
LEPLENIYVDRSYYSTHLCGIAASCCTIKE